MHAEVSHLENHFPWLKSKVGMYLEEMLEKVDDLDTTEVCSLFQLCKEDEKDFRPVATQEIVDEINMSQDTWTAGFNEKFVDSSMEDVKAYLGAVVDEDVYIRPPLKNIALAETIPDTFDPRVKWPACKDVIDHTRDQSNCGSCWAHGTTEAFNDRMCIKHGFTKLLSVADTTGCCSFLSCYSMGCNGGQIGTPWAWFKKTGVVTGGDFGDDK